MSGEGHIPAAAFAKVLESIMDQEDFYCYEPSDFNPDRDYKVRMYLTCECDGFRNHGHCKHTARAIKNPDWTAVKQR